MTAARQTWDQALLRRLRAGTGASARAALVIVAVGALVGMLPGVAHGSTTLAVFPPAATRHR